MTASECAPSMNATIISTISPSLAPVGVLLAVLGYVVGTYGAYICGLLLQGVSP